MAKDLYTSTLFKKCMAFARKQNPDAIYILSAKYGLLELETEVDPYDQTLNSMSASEVRAWSRRVLARLSQKANLQNDHFVILAGMKYRKYIVPHLTSYEVPMEGMRIGEQLQFLSRQF
jgi:hypothetical protein